MILDVFLVSIGIIIVLIAAQNGLMRSLLMLFVVWLISMIVGVGMLGFASAEHLARQIGEMLGGYPNNILYESIVFFLLFIFLNLGGLIFAASAFDDDALNDLGIFNTILGSIIGLIVAIIIMAVVANAWGVMVESYWQPDGAWKFMRYAYTTSLLRPFLNDVMGIYQVMLFPFMFSKYPKFYLIPKY